MSTEQTTEQLVETASEQTAEELEKSLVEARKISDFRAKSLAQLIGVYVDSFSAQMINNNGVSYNEKLQASRALKEAILFAMDFGVGVTNAKIREKGTLAKEVNGLAGVMVQAMDTRFLILADNMKKQQDEQALAETSQNETVQTEGDTNV